MPAWCYVDPAIAALDRRAIFDRGWQLVTHVSRLRAPGDHVVVDFAGLPVVAVRGEDGVVRAMHNVCRHRAAPILTDDSGCVGKLRCRYHGWTYSLTGRLKGTPEWDGVCDFEKQDNGLVPVGAVAEFGRWVWVSVAKPVRSVAEEFSPFPLHPLPAAVASHCAATSPTRGEVGVAASPPMSPS